MAWKQEYCSHLLKETRYELGSIWVNVEQPTGEHRSRQHNKARDPSPCSKDMRYGDMISGVDRQTGIGKALLTAEVRRIGFLLAVHLWPTAPFTKLLPMPGPARYTLYTSLEQTYRHIVHGLCNSKTIDSKHYLVAWSMHKHSNSR